MKVLLINQHPIVQKLVGLAAGKLNLELESLVRIGSDFDASNYVCIIVNDENIGKYQDMLTSLQDRLKVCLLKGKNSPIKNHEFNVVIKKPFLPTEILEILDECVPKDLDSKDIAPTQDLDSTPSDEADDIGGVLDDGLEMEDLISRDELESSGDTNDELQEAVEENQESGESSILDEEASSVKDLEDFDFDPDALDLSALENADIPSEDSSSGVENEGEVSEQIDIAEGEAESSNTESSLDDIDLGEIGDLDSTLDEVIQDSGDSEENKDGNIESEEIDLGGLNSTDDIDFNADDLLEKLDSTEESSVDSLLDDTDNNTSLDDILDSVEQEVEIESNIEPNEVLASDGEIFEADLSDIKTKDEMLMANEDSEGLDIESDIMESSEEVVDNLEDFGSVDSVLEGSEELLSSDSSNDLSSEELNLDNLDISIDKESTEGKDIQDDLILDDIQLPDVDSLLDDSNNDTPIDDILDNAEQEVATESNIEQEEVLAEESASDNSLDEVFEELDLSLDEAIPSEESSDKLDSSDILQDELSHDIDGDVDISDSVESAESLESGVDENVDLNDLVEEINSDIDDSINVDSTDNQMLDEIDVEESLESNDLMQEQDLIQDDETLELDEVSSEESSGDETLELDDVLAEGADEELASDSVLEDISPDLNLDLGETDSLDESGEELANSSDEILEDTQDLTLDDALDNVLDDSIINNIESKDDSKIEDNTTDDLSLDSEILSEEITDENLEDSNIPNDMESLDIETSDVESSADDLDIPKELDSNEIDSEEQDSMEDLDSKESDSTDLMNLDEISIDETSSDIPSDEIKSDSIESIDDLENAELDSTEEIIEKEGNDNKDNIEALTEVEIAQALGEEMLDISVPQTTNDSQKTEETETKEQEKDVIEPKEGIKMVKDMNADSLIDFFKDTPREKLHEILQGADISFNIRFDKK